MPGMYKGLVRPPQLEDVSCHQQECIGYLLQGHCQAAGAEPFGNGNEQCDSEQHQEQPPLQPPCPAINRKQHGEEEREPHQQQAGNGKLLEKLVAEVPVTRGKRLPQKLGEGLAVMPLCRKPTAALTGEITGVLYLLIEHKGFGQIIKTLAAIEQGQLQFTVETAHSLDVSHRITKQVITERHTGTDKGSRQAQLGMPQTENGIVDFLTDGIEQGHVIVQVLGTPVGLHNLDFRIGEEVVNITQIIVRDDIVRIEHQSDVIVIADGSHGGIQRFGLGAFLKMHFNQADRKHSEGSVGFGLHTVRNDNRIKTVGGIILLQT